MKKFLVNIWAYDYNAKFEVLAEDNGPSIEQAVLDKLGEKSVKMIVPPANQFTAERLLKSQGRVGTADNDINAVKSMGMIPQGYRVNNYLTDTDAWYLPQIGRAHV